MSLSDLVTEPVAGTGKGIVAGGKFGGKVGGITGAIAGALASTPAALGAGAIAAVVGLFFSHAIVAGLLAAAAVATVGAVIGGVTGGLGGGWLGAAGGGALGLVGGAFKGVTKLFQKSPEKQMDDMRTQSAMSDAQAMQAEAYIRQQQRIAASQAVGNPDAPSNNAAKIAAAAEQARSTSRSA
jgi:hypothetical protein